MAQYDLVLVGPRSPAPHARAELAAAIASRYGVPREALIRRLERGTFRVKRAVDLDTAKTYRADLESLGGDCEIVDTTTGEPIAELTPAIAPPTGLAAASGDSGADLGALGASNMMLASIDGSGLEHQLAPATPGLANASRFGPPASEESAPEELALAAEPGAWGPPPEREQLQLAEDPRALTALARSNGTDVPVSAPEPIAAAIAAGPPPEPKAPPPPPMLLRARRSLATRGRVYLVAGAASAMLAGLLIAHLVATYQEASAYAEVRAELLEAYVEADDPESHAGLGQTRVGARKLLDGRQRRIAITGGLLWILGAAAVAYVWFRIIDWERFQPR